MCKKGFDTGRLNLVAVGVSLSKIVGPLSGCTHLVGIPVTVNTVLNIVKRCIKPLRERLAYTLIQGLFCVSAKHLAGFGNAKHLIGFSRCHKWRHCFVTGSHSVPLFVVIVRCYCPFLPRLGNALNMPCRISYGMSTELPVVRRPSRSLCADTTSSSE